MAVAQKCLLDGELENLRASTEKAQKVLDGLKSFISDGRNDEALIYCCKDAGVLVHFFLN